MNALGGAIGLNALSARSPTPRPVFALPCLRCDSSGAAVHRADRHALDSQDIAHDFADMMPSMRCRAAAGRHRQLMAESSQRRAQIRRRKRVVRRRSWTRPEGASGRTGCGRLPEVTSGWFVDAKPERGRSKRRAALEKPDGRDWVACRPTRTTADRHRSFRSGAPKPPRGDRPLSLAVLSLRPVTRTTAEGRAQRSRCAVGLPETRHRHRALQARTCRPP